MSKWLIVAGAATVFTFSAFVRVEGAGALKEVIAYESDFSVYVDGKEIKSKSLVKDGVTYLPLREVGEAAGYDVTYASRDAKIELTAQTVTKEVYDMTSEINKSVSFEGTQINVKSLTYSDNYESQTAAEGRQYAILEVDVYTDSQPSTENWYATDFLMGFIANGKLVSIGIIIMGEENIYVPAGQQRTIKIAIALPDNQTVQGIKFKNPADKSQSADVIF
jgi:hypothetical protein